MSCELESAFWIFLIHLWGSQEDESVNALLGQTGEEFQHLLK